MNEKNIMIFTGEKSGEKHAYHLINEIKKIDDAIKISGTGSGVLNTTDFDSLGSIEKLNSFQYNFIDKIISIKKLKKRINRIEAHVIKNMPKVFIFIGIADDTQYFVKKLLKIAKKYGIKTLYYFSPHVWLFSKKKTIKVANEVDYIFTFFDLENNCYKNAGANTICIGHPIINELPEKISRGEYINKYKIPEHNKLVALLPGSRKKELKMHLPLLYSICKKYENNKDIFFITPLNGIDINEKWKQKFMQLNNHSFLTSDTAYYNTISRVDLSITSSGTACLETALYETPQIVYYILPKIDYFIWKIYALSKGIKTLNIAMPNIIAGKSIVAEFIQNKANVKTMTKEFDKLLNDSEEQTKNLQILFDNLKGNNPIIKAAGFITGLL